MCSRRGSLFILGERTAVLTFSVKRLDFIQILLRANKLDRFSLSICEWMLSIFRKLGGGGGEG